MSQFWIGPLLLALLCLVWFAVQRAWISIMKQPEDSDALERRGYCGTACACRSDCSRRGARASTETSIEET